MKAVIYARVSTNETRQEIENQLGPLRKLSQALNYELIKEYIDYARGGDSNRPQFREMLKSAKRHDFDIVLIWALDRFSREGILNTLSYIKTLNLNNVAIKSLQESWLDTRDKGLGELLLSIFSWVAKQESLRLSERIKAGQKGKVNIGKRGRDRKPRRKSGYLSRYQKNTPPEIENFSYIDV